MTDAAAGTAADRKGPDVGLGTLIAGDGLRGVGMLLVFFTHVLLFADVHPDNNLQSFGWAAQIIGPTDLSLASFFVLSGYLIARPFARAYVAGTRRPRLRSYVRNRTLRVVPAFYFFTVLALLRFGLDGTLQEGSPAGKSEWWQILGQFAFIQGQTGGPAVQPTGPAWSIGAEVGFYILIPIAAGLSYMVAARLGSPRRRAALVLAVLAVVTFVSIALRAQDKYLFAWLVSPPAIMFIFMPGVAVAIVEPLIAGRLRANVRWGRILGWGAIACAALLAALYGITDYDPRQTPLHHALGQRALFAAMSTGALIFGLVVLQLGTGGAPRLFANRVMGWMGARSLSFYLVHVWVLLEIDHLLGGGESIAERALVMMAIGLPLTTASAALSYRYVERPFLERKRKVVSPDASGSAPPPSEPVPVAVGPAR